MSRHVRVFHCDVAVLDLLIKPRSDHRWCFARCSLRRGWRRCRYYHRRGNRCGHCRSPLHEEPAQRKPGKFCLDVLDLRSRNHSQFSHQFHCVPTNCRPTETRLTSVENWGSNVKSLIRDRPLPGQAPLGRRQTCGSVTWTNWS